MNSDRFIKRIFRYVKKKYGKEVVLDSVVFILGPYRNCTTLTAGVLFLHPQVQVQNHGMPKLWSEHTDFLTNYDELKFNTFVNSALKRSSKVVPGYVGGSIKGSHAFSEKHRLPYIYKKRFGDIVIKEDPKCLVWKESLKITHLIREKNVDFDNLFRNNDKIRFIMPIRNPVDCAISNCNTYHHKLWGKGRKLKSILTKVLDEFKYFFDLQEAYPDRFLYFSTKINKQTLIHLEKFMKIKHDILWIEDVFACWRLKPSYKPSKSIYRFYAQQIMNRFSGDNLKLLMEFENDYKSGV